MSHAPTPIYTWPELPDRHLRQVRRVALRPRSSLDVAARQGRGCRTCWGSPDGCAHANPRRAQAVV